MISVLMPAYNVEKFVEFAIQSVLDQEVPMPLEIIIVDDGSTDSTAPKILKMSEGDHRIRLIQTENAGVSAARNRAFSEVNSETRYIAYLDTDDGFPPGRLARDLKLFADDPTLDVVYGRQGIIYSEHSNLARNLPPSLPNVRGPSINVATFRREIIEENNGFDLSFTHGEDLDFLFRLFERDPNVKILDEISLYYRQRDGSACGDKTKLEKGVRRAQDFHDQRLEADPSLLPLDELFEMNNFGTKSMAKVFAQYSRNEFPKYSVVVPAYNAEKFLAETISSIRKQTHPPAQIIVVNDGSTDNTSRILKTLGSDIEVLEQPNLGAAMATNTGIRAARNEYIAFLDADDLWEPEKIAKQFFLLISQPSLGMVFCRMTSFNHDESPLAVDDTLSGWGRSTMLVKREVFDQVGLVSDFKKHAGEMIDWVARAKEAKVGYQLIEAPLVKRRVHRNSMTAQNPKLQEDYLEVVKEAIRRRRIARRKQNDV